MRRLLFGLLLCAAGSAAAQAPYVELPGTPRPAHGGSALAARNGLIVVGPRVYEQQADGTWSQQATLPFHPQAADVGIRRILAAFGGTFVLVEKIDGAWTETYRYTNSAPSNQYFSAINVELNGVDFSVSYEVTVETDDDYFVVWKSNYGRINNFPGIGAYNLYVHSVNSGYAVADARNGELCNLPSERVVSYIVESVWQAGSDLLECHEDGMINFGPLVLGSSRAGPQQYHMTGWTLAGPSAEWVRLQPLPSAAHRLPSSMSGLGHAAAISLYQGERGLTMYRATPDTTDWAGPVVVDATADCEDTATAPGFLVCWPDRANARVYDLLNWLTVLERPQPLAPADGEILTEVPRLVWASVPGARSYTLEYTNEPDFWSAGVIRVEGLADTSVVVPLSQGLYRWRVWAEAANTGSAWSRPRTFRAGTVPPPAPALEQPADGVTWPGGPLTLVWGSSVQATRYRVHVARDVEFADLVVDETTTNRWFVVDSLAPGPNHVWRVRAENAAGDGAWSAVRSFRFAHPPSAAPTLLAPPNGELGIATNARFLWTPTSPVGTHEIEFAHTPLFDPAARRHDVGDSTYVPDPPLERNRLYFWRARGTTVDGPGAWSAVHSFTTSSTIAGDASPESLVIGAPRPNPARATAALDVSLPVAGHVRVEVFDALGRVIAVPLDGDLAAGRHAVQIATVSMPAGVYVVRVSARPPAGDAHVAHHRLAVVR